MAGLTGKQSAFIEAYCANGFNATQAAITAGYSENTASETGYENLNKPQIAEAITAYKEKVSKIALVTTEDIVRGLLREAKGEEVENKSSDRIAALKALSDYTGGFDANKKQVDITSGGESIVNEWHIHPTTAKDA